MGAVSFGELAASVMDEKVVDVSVAREGRKMSVVADPNAIQHLDALFDVVHVRRSHSVTTTNTELLDALFEVVHSSPDSSASAGTTPNAKSWKERELPPSFFNAGSSPRPRIKSPEKCKLPEPQNSQKTVVPSSSRQKSHLHKLSTSLPTLRVLSTNPVAYAVALPLTWSSSKPSDCLTYYIDKNLHCSVNLEPAVERRRRLARGRVQKYRSRKRWQKVNSTEDTKGIHVVKIESVC